jgi:SagB-type dehydrogenase family enzyme
VYALAAVLGGQPLQRAVHECLSALKRLQALSYVVRWGRQTVARILPLTGRSFWDRDATGSPGPLVLCSDAYLRFSKKGLHILAPTAYAEVIVNGTLINGLMARVCDPCSSGSPSDPELCLLQHLLGDTGHLAAVNKGADDHAAQWPFADLLFHAASRLGNEWGSFGRHSGQSRPIPAVQPQRAAVSNIDLRAAASTLPQTDLTFTAALDGRRSRRYPGPRPLSLAELAVFLSLAAEPRATDDQAGGWRYPYPSGGGIYGFHIYVVIHRCFQLEPGLYRHAAEDRALEKLDARPDQVELLAAHCGYALGLENAKPDAVLILTAEIGEFTARYDAIAYRLVLLGAGCLIQNMYLVASALGLAGCAVGGGNPVLFAQIAGADPVTEPSVAEFALSGRAP